MAQYGQEQYGTVQYGGGTQVVGTSTATLSASGQVTSASGTGTNTATLSASGQVTSVFDTGTSTFTFLPTGTGDVVAIADSGTTTFAFDPSGVVTSEADSGTANFVFSPDGLVTFPLAPTGVNWYLNRTNKDEYAVFNGDTSNYPNITIGEETTFSFYIKDIARFQDAETRYNRAIEYGKYAGYTSVNRTLGDVYYHTTTDFSRADIDSQVISLEPGDEIDQARGVWGVVTGVDDTTEIFGAIARIDMTVMVLAEYDEFDTHSDVSTAFESNL